ncbi:MAG: type IV pilin [Methanoregula sp.]|jgi:FlaG/FlaF family flagellin (archaellin)|nr:type IV pilin [Methanoregula sp.]
MKSRSNGEAVSPVVGVMLMLVVVIIIAAVVSAFAGGLTTTKDKAPTTQIRADYSVTNGMKIEHVGGDTIPTMGTTVMVRPSKTWGTADHITSIVNKSSITNGGKDNGVYTGTSNPCKFWLKPTGSSDIKSFATGDVAYIKPPYNEGPFLNTGSSKTYWFNRTDAVGRTFWLELADEGGRVFAKTEVTVAP